MINIPGVNFESAIYLYGNDMEIYLTVLRSYAANIPESIEIIRDTSEANLPTYAIEMHSIKSASGSIGAENIWEKALHLERMAKDNVLHEINKGTSPIIEELLKLVADIQNWLDEYDKDKVKLQLALPDKSMLKTLMDCCLSYDMDGIDDAMDALERVDYKNDADLVKWLREKVNALDVPGIVARLSDYLSENKSS